MSAAPELAHFDVVDDEPFFAPAPSDLFDSLVNQYRASRKRIEEVAAIVAGDLYAGVMDYFVRGNCSADDRFGTVRAEKLYALDGAIAALNAAYWSKALGLTDVLDLMPQKRRDEWHESIRDQTTPDFEEDTVRATIIGLLNMRQQFLAERVDGIFRGLSGDHVTNAPEGFGKRMIIAGVLSSYGTSEHSRTGLINDLRCVVAKFMGRDEPSYGATTSVIDQLKRRWGKWLALDGGALRIRLYMKGTAHLEVHPDMAWRLNCVLAHLYPLAIPAEFRAKPKKRSKDFALMAKPLPFAVVNRIASLEVVRERVGGPDAWPVRHVLVPGARAFGYGACDKAVARDAMAVLTAIGGVPVKHYIQFDYEPDDVLDEIVASGCIPHQQAHQFYPTPEGLARRVVEAAEIGDDHTVLEPSAGNGDLAAALPRDRTTCVEVSALRCSVLKARGFTAVNADFLDWSHDRMCEGLRFDRVVMNPPFSEGRAMDHLVAASLLVKPAGRLVAILPASMRGKEPLNGFLHSWGPIHTGEFVGTGVAVAILAATREEA